VRKVVLRKGLGRRIAGGQRSTHPIILGPKGERRRGQRTAPAALSTPHMSQGRNRLRRGSLPI
jgi:hypothetical protein